MNVCLDNIFWSADRFGTRLGTILQQHETEPRMKRWDDCVDGQGQGKSLKLLQRWDYCVQGQGQGKSLKLLQRWDYCVQGQGKSLKLLQMFVGSIFSVPLNSWQPNYWCYGTVTNNQTKCKQSGCILTVTL